MSGHNRWAKLKRRKLVDDGRRSKVWTKLLMEMQVAARLGGGDPAGNPRLRLAIDRARAVNMPKERIRGAIDKGTGALGGEALEEIVYEAYGPGGIALVIEALTDNRARTVADVRHALERGGGHLGATGSVAWMFHRKGIVHVLATATTEDRLVELALDAGAADVRAEGEVFTVECPPAALHAVTDALAAAGIAVESAELEYVPETRVMVEPARAPALAKLLANLDDLDDVQRVHGNHDGLDDEA